MSPEERGVVVRLHADLRESRLVHALTAVACLAVLLGIVAIVVFPRLGNSAPAIGIGVGLAIAAMAWKSRPRFQAELREDLRGGEVELVHVHAFGARTAPGRTGFFFDVGDGQLLVVRGHYLRAAVAEGRFPNRYFTLVRLPRAGITLGLECHGELIDAPEADRGITSIPEGTLIAGSLD